MQVAPSQPARLRRWDAPAHPRVAVLALLAVSTAALVEGWRRVGCAGAAQPADRTWARDQRTAVPAAAGSRRLVRLRDLEALWLLERRQIVALSASMADGLLSERHTLPTPTSAMHEGTDGIRSSMHCRCKRCLTCELAGNKESQSGAPPYCCHYATPPLHLQSVMTAVG